MKFKYRKILTTTLAIAAPVLVVVSCGVQNISIINESEINKRGFTKDKKAGALKNSNIALITDAGKTNDKSFNQSGWEISKIFAKDADVKVSSIEPSEQSRINAAYKTASDAGAKVLVLPGYAHNEHLVQALPAGTYAIQVDGTIQSDASYSGDPSRKNRIAALKFKVEEAGFKAGYAAAHYLVEVKKDKDPRIGTFLGGPFKGVIEFPIGFLLGVAEFNHRNTDPTKPKVKFAGDHIAMSTGFQAGAAQTTAEQLINNKADIILPVAGPQTADALKAAEGTNTLIVGVDTDQSKQYPNNKGKFFTSITKNMGQAIYDVLQTTYRGDMKYFGHETIGGIQEGWTGLVPTRVSGAKASFKAAETFFSDIKRLPVLNVNSYEEKFATLKSAAALQKTSIANISELVSSMGVLTLSITDLYDLFKK